MGRSQVGRMLPQMSRERYQEPMANYSDYIVFADESGDHGLSSIDPQFPVFSLVFAIFEKEVYAAQIEPDVRRFKFRHFGHDAVILHEHDIRKEAPPFDRLRDAGHRKEFIGELSEIMSKLPMYVYASVILKERLRAKYANPWNPYEVALHFCLERLCRRLVRDGQQGRTVHVLFESRGKREDGELELEFRRIVANESNWGWRRTDFSVCRFEPVFVAKAANMAGHQLTDLIARPLALRILRPDQPNRAAESIWDRVAELKTFPG